MDIFTKWLSRLSIFFAVFGITSIVIFFLPSISNFSFSENEINGLSQTSTANKIYQPRFDPTLPKENRLEIPSIGVDTVIQEATYKNYEDALRKGVWRVSDFGDPYSRAHPTILAAHRFGYLAWTNLYRRHNSFYNLPKLKVGEVVEITWRQRKYLYEIYGESEGEEINDYGADLILYTCETLSGPVRIFKYARLLEI